MAGAKDHRGGSAEARGCSAGHSGGQRGERFERAVRESPKDALPPAAGREVSSDFWLFPRFSYLTLNKNAVSFRFTEVTRNMTHWENLISEFSEVCNIEYDPLGKSYLRVMS